MNKYFSLFMAIILFVNSTSLPSLLLENSFSLPEIAKLQKPNEVKADYAFSPTSVLVTQGNEESNYSYIRASDNSYYNLLSTSSGIDAAFTINNVNLGNANIMYINYDGSVSSASLTYEIQIRDFHNNVWRNIIPHGLKLANTTNAGAGLMTQLTASVNNGTMFPIYNGYFTDGNNTPLDLPLSYFINGSNQTQIRFLYDGTTPNLEMRIDYLSVEPALDNMAYASSMTIADNAGTAGANEYNDTTSDDNSANLRIDAGTAGINAYFSFAGLPAPYSGANTIMVEFSGFRTTADYSLAVWDFTNSQWDILSAHVLSNGSDATNFFAVSTGQAVSDYLSNGANGGEIRIQVSSSSTSGSVTIDYLRVTVGSVTTNADFYVGTVTRGGDPTGTVENTKNLDTSDTISTWSIPTSTADTRTTNEFPLDCGTATNSCVAANIQIPIQVPTNSLVTGIHTAIRYAISSASVDLDFGLRSKRFGNVTLTDVSADATSQDMMIRTASYPLPPQTGLNPVASAIIYQNGEYSNTADNSVNLYVRTAATSVATAQTLAWDFAFVSIRTTGGNRSITAAWTPTGANLTYGTNSNSNYRFTNADDNYYWTLSQNGVSGTDAYLSFSNIVIPNGANKMILTTNIRWSTASTAFKMYIWDFSGDGQWRDITPHSGNFTSDTTANREEFLQLEIFNGYFTDGANNPVDTPLSTFVSGKEARIRIASSSTASSMGVDYSLMEFVKDPVYYPASVNIINGTITAGTEYNDLFTDDATSNFAVTYSNGLTYDYNFTNVITPPEKSNAIYLTYSGFRTTITNYSLSLRNYGGNGCNAGYEAFNSIALNNTSDLTNYFIKSISNWSCYISGGQMQIRLTTTGSSGSVTTDYVKMILGSVNTDSEPSSIRLGSTYTNGVTQTRNMDTSNTSNPFADTWRVTSYPNNQSVRTMDSLSAVAGSIDLPLTLPANSYPISLIWAARGALSSATGTTLTMSFEDRKNYYNDAVNYQATMVGAAALPNGGNSIIIGGSGATTAQIIKEGWHILNVPNSINSTNDTVSFRYRTSAGTTFSTIVFDIDAVFVALRYVD